MTQSPEQDSDYERQTFAECLVEILLTVFDAIFLRCFSAQLSDTTSSAIISRDKSFSKSTTTSIVVNFYKRCLEDAIFKGFLSNCGDERQLLLEIDLITLKI